jgi:hypothetical protein
MKVLSDFFSLRPIWTRRCLEIVWLIYCLATLIQLALLAVFAYPAIGNANFATYLSFALQIVHALALLLLVRIFLEIALRVLIKDEA